MTSLQGLARSSLLTIALIGSGLAHAQPPPYPAGIWFGELVDPNTLVVDNVTLTILPSGQYWGVVDETIIGGSEGNDCPWLIWGNLVKGGLGVTASRISYNVDPPATSGPPTLCTPPPASTWGNATITLTSPTTAKWSVNNPLLIEKVYSLTLSSSTYNQPSSFKAIAGYWHSEADGYTEIVTPTGASISFNPTLGCISSGQYTIVNSAHSLYSFTETVYDCDSAVFNGPRNGVATVSKVGTTSSLGKQTSAQTSQGIVNVTEGTGGLYYGH